MKTQLEHMLFHNEELRQAYLLKEHYFWNLSQG